VNEYTQQAKELVKAEDGKPGLVVGNRVFSPHQYDASIPDFSSKHYLFLNAYRYGVPIEAAASKADMTPDQAERFLGRADVVAWLKDRALKDYIKYEWSEPAKWYQLGEEVLEGRRKMDKAQSLIWQEFGKRVAPAKGEGSSHGTTKIELHISPESVQAALRRQDAIDAELA
jgi:hypothetical protein